VASNDDHPRGVVRTAAVIAGASVAALAAVAIVAAGYVYALVSALRGGDVQARSDAADS
jgi:hypothetical protein